MSATREIATFIYEADIRQFPGEAVQLAKRSILDCMGVTLAGSVEPAGKIIVEFVRESGGKPQATVINSGFKTSASLAALANGTMAHALDYDDVFATGGGHSSVTIVPLVFALGEIVGASGSKILEAYLAGFEVGARISDAIEPSHSEKGWHPTATVNALRGTAAGAKLLGLTVDQIEVAFGLAASLAGGLRFNIGTMTKPLHAGNAARNGIMACLLAAKGFSAEPGVLEQSPYGFCEVFGGGEKPALDKLTTGLGKQFQIISPGMGIKKYPCVAGIHSAIDAILMLTEQHSLTAGMVESIACGVRKMRPQTLRSKEPKTPLEGKFNLAYGLARALLDRELGLQQFTQQKVDDPAVIELMRKIHIDVDPELVKEQAGKNAVIVAVRLTDGRVVSQRVDKARGTSKYPLTDEEVQRKYRQCAGLVLAPDKIEQTLAILQDLENVPDVGNLVGLLG